MDTRLTFNPHLQAASGKAVKAAVAIGRLMPNVAGVLSGEAGALHICSGEKLDVHFIDLGAMSRTRTTRNKAAMMRAQRSAALRITRAYRTVSAEAVTMIAESPTGDLTALERAKVQSTAAKE